MNVSGQGRSDPTKCPFPLFFLKNILSNDTTTIVEIIVYFTLVFFHFCFLIVYVTVYSRVITVYLQIFLSIREILANISVEVFFF